LPSGARKFNDKDIDGMCYAPKILNQPHLVLKKLHQFSEQNIFLGPIR